MNLAQLEHRLEHAEKALLRAGLSPAPVPGEPQALPALLEAATDEELARLETSTAGGDEVGQAETLSVIARRLDASRPASLSPLQAALVAEQRRRRGDLDVDGLAAVLSVDELQWLASALRQGRPLPGGTQLDGEPLRAAQELCELGRRRFLRWSASRSGLTSRTARAARARDLWARRERSAEIARQAGERGLSVRPKPLVAEAETVDDQVASPEPLFESAEEEAVELVPRAASSSAGRSRPNARVVWPGRLASGGAHGLVYERDRPVSVLVFAGRGAVEEAERWGFSGVVETAVEAAFAAGRASMTGEHGFPLPAEKRLVELPGDLIAYVRRDGATPAGRERWRILSVRRRERRGIAA